jgi:hypothetical protein
MATIYGKTLRLVQGSYDQVLVRIQLNAIPNIIT